MIRSCLSIILVFWLHGTFARAYWQQEAHYKIEVSLNDTLHELHAFLELTYINHSPDTLNYIIFHLWPNAYKNHETAFARQQLGNRTTSFYYSTKKKRGYIDDLEFRSNNKDLSWTYDPLYIDIARVNLAEPLLPGGKVVITTPFHIKIPRTYSRLGHYRQSYQITQWYPKPAVYDREGWHPMPYLDQGEFYSEFGSFDVKITLPDNYVVGATGVLQNPEEIEWMNNKAAETASIVDFSDDESFPPSSKTTKTLHYKQDKIHDFAWFADKRFHVLKGEIALPGSGRTVQTWALFTNEEADLWKKSIPYINDAVYYYSKWVGEYPYDHCTALLAALSAGGGMEYPMVTVISSMPDDKALENVIIHEVGHNWFYGILGSNERDHAWMDEGINSFYERRLLETLHPGRNILGDADSTVLAKWFDLQHISLREDEYLGYLLNARRSLDQPLALRADSFTMLNYGALVYGKASYAFNYLMHAVGEEKFDRTMQKYYETWKFKHPGPDDLRLIFEAETGLYLGWFFDHLIKTTWKSDFKIAKVLKDTMQIGRSSFYQVRIVNGGKYANNHAGFVKGPYTITAYKDKVAVRTVDYDGFWGTMDVLFPYGVYDKFRIDAKKVIPENNRQNNTLRTRGIFRKVEPIRLQFLASLENPERTQLFYSPVAGWNNYDKTMAGLAFYNSIIPSKTFEYVLVPMYGFGSQQFTGTGRLGKYWYPRKEHTLFQSVGLEFSGASFHGITLHLEDGRYPLRYNKFHPRIIFEFRNANPRSAVKKQLSYHWKYLQEGFLEADRTTNYREYYINQLTWSYTNDRIINPNSYALQLEQGIDFVKTSLEANYGITYEKPQKGLDIRIYAGTYIHHKSNDGRYRLRLSGDYGFSTAGINDYGYDDIYLGRVETEGVFSRQIAVKHGGFRNQTIVGQTDQWMATINLKSSFFGKIPVKPYLDAGFYWGMTEVALNTGLALVVLPEIFEIYIPVFHSRQINREMEFSRPVYINRVTFMLNFNNLEPFRMLRAVSL